MGDLCDFKLKNQSCNLVNSVAMNLPVANPPLKNERPWAGEEAQQVC